MLLYVGEQHYTDEASPYWRDLSSYANHIETNDYKSKYIKIINTTNWYFR